MTPAFQNYGRYVNPPLAKFLSLSGRDQCFVRAEGSSLTTESGDVYADWIAGFGSMNLGHNPRAIVEALRDHLTLGAPNLYIESLNPYAGRLAERLVPAAGAGFGTCFFCNSGTEAVEAAIKLAMAAAGRRSIVYCAGGYHGTTLGSLSMMARGEYRRPFEPLLADFVEIPFNDTAALESALANKPAALVLEPIQVESGIRIAEPAYLRAAKRSCERHGALLILDEVQTGMGRTGTLFAHHAYDVAPDVLVLAKSLGGGVVPLGAIVIGEGLFQRAYGDGVKCEIHNSTFGGNALACVAGLEALKQVAQPEFLAQVAARANELWDDMAQAIGTHPLVVHIAFKGLLGGVRLREIDHPWFSWTHWGMEAFADRPATGALLVHRLHRRRFLTQLCGHDWSTLRVEPPLIVTRDECRRFVAALKSELDWITANA